MALRLQSGFGGDRQHARRFEQKIDGYAKRARKRLEKLRIARNATASLPVPNVLLSDSARHRKVES